MYEIIEKNQYGVLVRKIKSIPTECEKCKYTGLAVALQPCKSCKADNSYYLPDSEAEKLESEKQLMNTTIDDLYIESKCYFEVKKKLDDTQKELIDLQNENKQLKERVKELEGTIENMKAISLPKEEVANGVTSVDYPSDNETEVIDSPYSSIIGQWLITKCCSFLIKDNFNYCPNCGRKIIR